jgi:hypothetical protein
MNSNLLLLLVVSFGIISCQQQQQQKNSYIFTPDKYIVEELDEGSLVADLEQDLKDKNYQKQQFTLLEDSKLTTKHNLKPASSYFQLDPSTGLLNIKNKIDREYMCLHRLCSDPCELSKNNEGACRVNLKVLLLPSYDILNLNVFIQDINDNEPKFHSKVLNKEISEGLPIGYKV